MGRGALTFRLVLPVPAAEAFAWHERPGISARLAPPWVVERGRPGPLADCSHVRRVVPEGAGCVLEDRLEWRRASGPFSAAADARLARELARRFAWRHRVT
ncbi:MAG TPA: hypothetical protein VI504_16310, partial [Candidatus Eisenbacteria bacterium]